MVDDRLRHFCALVQLLHPLLVHGGECAAEAGQAAGKEWVVFPVAMVDVAPASWAVEAGKEDVEVLLFLAEWRKTAV